ncbi:PTS IIA-like nitrogen regulatory protein PtsN [Alsobacter sp. SYSU M60028]|uniref:PTS IIA-like nitrogen regulatory protein PtsN n=1 Tax=Alsobacter ponti TaxID=2962936 RepID=A0ABT1LCM8_9HYPH|nr:PTS IIA-like nitrogen regulatory protein PtsN [Alsobacter ponti]MCP8938831.1 PTS IIA-like nitrogen regulatory protein PtsN [Alsobacter ponti]
MPLTDFLTPEAVVPSLRASSKKQALQEMAAKAAELSGLPEREIFETLLQRERLGSTGIGQGIAIPHGKLARVEKLFGVFGRLDRPIDFEALDGEPVDLVFVLIAPESAGADHLKALARVARALRDQTVTQKLRAARDAAALYSVLTQAPGSQAA